MYEVILCADTGCRLRADHKGKHDTMPDSAWSFLQRPDADKVGKAGYATPRGGDKGAYQNHVYRNGRVIVPYERLSEIDLTQYKDGYIIRIFPDQYFASAGMMRAEFKASGAPVVGKDAFVLYRSHRSLAELPPLQEWKVRGLEKDGVARKSRGPGVLDTGHYVLRLPNAGAGRPKDYQGPAQGIFAPEYATAEVNFLSRAMLVWLIVHTRNSPYTTIQAAHVKAILTEAGLLEDGVHEEKGITRNGLACCPLCLRVIDYTQLHGTVDFANAPGLGNAGIQVEGATRSTEVNLFHMVPLVYASLEHEPLSIGWGHSVCNTLLGQRRCYSVAEVQAMQQKVAVLVDDEVITFGWITDDWSMIRSPRGAVWVRLSESMTEEEWEELVPSHPTLPGERVDVVLEGGEADDSGVQDIGEKVASEETASSSDAETL